MTVVAIIPARGGSKRIPRKNVRPFRGRPMLTWPIETALSSEIFDRVIVSTDDPEISNIAIQSGAEVPFTRPSSLADDHTSTAVVMQHAVGWLQDSGDSVTECCCIYPTTPFLTTADLSGAQGLLRSRQASYALAVAQFDHPAQRALIEDPRGRVHLLQPEHAGTRTQDLTVTFHDAGQFCWGVAQKFADGAPVLSSNTAPWFLPRWRAIDIDDEDDWRLAERLHEAASSTGLR